MLASIVDRDVVEVAGRDASSYLQGQISQDVDSISAGGSAWSLVLAPTGKLTAWFRLHRVTDDRFLIDVEAGWAAPLVERLERFKLRTAVEFSLLDGWRMLSVRKEINDADPEQSVPTIQAALSQAALSQAALSQAALSQAALSQAALSQAALSQAALSQAALSQAALSQAALSQAALSQAALSQAALSQAALSQAALSQAALSQAALSATFNWPGFSGSDHLDVGLDALSGIEIDDAAFEQARIRAGVPRLGLDIGENTIPAEGGANLIEGSVSFTKGCYTGQELVARINSRGGNVPRPLRVLIGEQALEIGGVVTFDGREAGVVTSAAGTAALAPLMRKVEPGSLVSVNGVKATVQASS